MKLRTRPKYYYRSFAAINILIFLWLLYSAINGAPSGWILVVLIGFASAYWIFRAIEEWMKI